MKMSKKWPRASGLLLVMLLCISILSDPAYAKTDESKWSVIIKVQSQIARK